jgi:Domain of unknown function (DUF4157)
MRVQVAQPRSKETVAKAQGQHQPQPAVQKPQPRGMAAELLNLQRTHGNRFVQQMLNGGMIQRKCACSGGCASCQSRSPHREQVTIHNILQRNGSGQLLEPDIRAFMESRFGKDFSSVRVHTDARATQTAQQLNAVAYTVGRDIFFAAGQYRPQSQGGKGLLAHELTHVLQQCGTSQTPQYKPTYVPTLNDPLLENEADKVGTRVALGKSVVEMVSDRVADGAQAQMQKAGTSPDQETQIQPDIPKFPINRLQDVDLLPLPWERQVDVFVAARMKREGPLVVGPFRLPTNIAGIKIDQTYGPFFLWVENERVAGWMPAVEVPTGPRQIGNWWIWSNGERIEVAPRYPEQESVVRSEMQKQLHYEPGKRDVKRRVESGQELNRSIEYYMSKGGKSLWEAIVQLRRDRQELLEMLVQAYFQTFQVYASFQAAKPAIESVGKALGKIRKGDISKTISKITGKGTGGGKSKGAGGGKSKGAGDGKSTPKSEYIRVASQVPGRKPDIGVLELRADGSDKIVVAHREDVRVETGGPTHINLEKAKLEPITKGANRYRLYLNQGFVTDVESFHTAEQIPKLFDRIERALQRYRLVHPNGTIIRLFDDRGDRVSTRVIKPW